MTALGYLVTTVVLAPQYLSTPLPAPYDPLFVADRPDVLAVLNPAVTVVVGALRIADTAGFCRDLRRVAEGGVALDPEVITAMPSRRDDAVEQLSTRRREVLALIAQGRSNAGIARVLGISEKSVVTHTSGIYDALGLAPYVDDHRRVLAAVRYLTR